MPTKKKKVHKIVRKPRPWTGQKIFFDIVHYNSSDEEIFRRASFICNNCRHICEWDEESDAFRCVDCGKKLTAYGAVQILYRYRPQFDRLLEYCKRKLTEDYEYIDAEEIVRTPR